MLIKLLEVLSGEHLPKPTKGRMRIHCLENVDKALQFLKEQRVHLENMGSHDIVDGNHRLILGLIWTIILRFQLQDIVVETQDNREPRCAKDALLLWCQMKTAGYPNVNITNFTTSWKDGMAFNALIHKHRSDLVDFDKLKKSNPTHNLRHAFDVAEQQLGVTKLLDPEDVFTENPDEKSIITYVVAFYHYFSKMKALAVEGKRVGKKMIEKYESLASDLLTWIEQTIITLNSRTFANSLTGVQQQLQAFNSYRTTEKPPKFQEKGNLEVMLYTIQSRMRANNQKLYTPHEGALVSDINRGWERLEKAEHSRELALRNELIRQEKLEQLARRFDRKAAMRETWLIENQRLVAQDNFGLDLLAVEAAKKKHDAIETDIGAYQERVQALLALSNELEAENYHDSKRINARKDNILRLWEYLLELLSARRARLEMNLALQKTFQEMLHIIIWMDDMKDRLLSPDFGKHLLEVEDLLQKHCLVEADIAVQAERVRSANTAALRFTEGDGYKPCDPQVIKDRVQHLDLCYQELCALAAQRKARLQQSRRLWNFFWEMDEIESWIKEKEHIFSTMDYGKDLTSVMILQSKHSAFEDELGARRAHLQQTAKEGEKMVKGKHFGSPKIKERSEDILRQWEQLEDLAAFRKQNLRDAQNFFQFQGDVDDLKAWLQDTYRIMSSNDVGHDEYSTQLLAKKHRDLQNEAIKYRGTMEALIRQEDSLPDELRSTPDIQRRLKDIKELYVDLLSLADQRRQKLQDTLALYTIFSETDACELWMNQKKTWLVGLETPEKLEELEIVQNRLEILGQEMNNVETRVADVNQAAKQLEDSRHPSVREVKECQTRLNRRWDEFKRLVDEKKKNVDSALSLHNYGLECDETETWILEKTHVVESTQDLGNDLAAVITIQRKLYGIERDLAAIQAKLKFLEAEADRLAAEHPENAKHILGRQQELHRVWDDLKQTLRDREDSLGEVSKLQTFLQDLDDFQAWLFKTQKAIASEEIPNSLPEAEQLLSLHNAVKDDVDHHQDDYHKVKDTGAGVTQGETDPQYQQLEQRLRGLDTGWDELHKMWDSRKNFLEQGLGFQQFMKDAKQAESILNNQEHNINVFANHIVTYNTNLRKAKEVTAKLKDNNDLQHFLQNTQDLTFWINEKMLTAQDTSYDEARNLHSKWQKHKAFMAELASNKNWLDKIDQEGEQLMLAKPELTPLVSKRLDEVHRLWDELESTTQDKAQRLFDANRSELLEQSYSDLDRCLKDLSQQLQSEDYGKDLTSANILLKKHQVTEKQVEERQRELVELLSQDPLKDGSQTGEYAQVVEKKFQNLLAPLRQRREKLQASRAVHQFYRDLADEILWVEERLPLATSTDHGNNMQAVQLLMKKNQFRDFARDTGSIGQERVDNVNRVIDGLIDREHSEAATMAEWKDNLNESWGDLLELIDTRSQLLTTSYDLHKYFYDGKELLALLQEKHTQLPADVGGDVSTAESFHRMHAAFERDIHTLGKQVQQFQDSAARLHAQYVGDQADAIQHTEHEVVEAWKALLDACDGRRTRLVDTADKFRFFSMVRDLMSWMESIIRQIETQEKPRDVSSVELLMKYHQGIKAEMDARNRSFSTCVDLGMALLARKHQASQEIKEKLIQLTEKKKEMLVKWDDRWDWLRLLHWRGQLCTIQEVQGCTRRDDSRDITGDSSHFHTVEEQTLVSGVEEKPDLLNGTEFSEDSSFERTDKSELDESLGQRPSQSLLLPAPTETERAATLPTPTQRHQAVQREGALVRKHDLEGPDKRASNRSWNNIYCVLKPEELSCYKDAKNLSYGITYHGEDPLSLRNAACEILTNYKKKKHVFRLRLHDGSEYLFQAKDEEELQSWVQAVQNAIPQQGESQGPSTEGRAHRLPTQPSTSASRDSGGGKKDKEKRFSNPFAKKK
ncbi:UNVERIFIED_CONTAM: hypothetical protein FKN15_050523 [Acipenser sinensis]